MMMKPCYGKKIKMRNKTKEKAKKRYKRTKLRWNIPSLSPFSYIFTPPLDWFSNNK